LSSSVVNISNRALENYHARLYPLFIAPHTQLAIGFFTLLKMASLEIFSGSQEHPDAPFEFPSCQDLLELSSGAHLFGGTRSESLLC
jgi:hypothetical protein